MDEISTHSQIVTDEELFVGVADDVRGVTISFAVFGLCLGGGGCTHGGH